MHVKADHRAAGVFINVKTLDVQRVNRKDIAVRFPLGGAAPP